MHPQWCTAASSPIQPGAVLRTGATSAGKRQSAALGGAGDLGKGSLLPGVLGQHFSEPGSLLGLLPGDWAGLARSWESLDFESSSQSSGVSSWVVTLTLEPLFPYL